MAEFRITEIFVQVVTGLALFLYGMNVMGYLQKHPSTMLWMALFPIRLQELWKFLKSKRQST